MAATPSNASGSLSEFGPESGGRVKGLTIVKPVVIGNSARYFGKKRDEDGHTHQWTVYLKPYLNEDYSAFIKRVHFKLHDSYANPNRIVAKPPYEVTETGWGEFDIVIKIHFNDPMERPVTMYHMLKLFQSSPDHGNPVAVKKTIVSETYDEIVFQEPTLLMKTLLEHMKPITDSVYKHDVDFEENKKTSLAKLEDARSKVKSEIHDLKEKLKIAQGTIDSFKTKLYSLQNSNSGEELSFTAQAELDP